jgi:TfoX/Sxy family transcriptional regulator of competence genes
VAYDQDLANRIREQLADQESVSEKEMFGGIAFLLSANMAVGVSGDDVMVRVGREAGDEAVEQPHISHPVMSDGRVMRNWVLVAPEGVETDAQLSAWVGRGVAFARSLPPKS